MLPVQCQLQTTETQSHYYQMSVKIYLINMWQVSLLPVSFLTRNNDKLHLKLEMAAPGTEQVWGTQAGRAQNPVLLPLRDFWSITQLHFCLQGGQGWYLSTRCHETHDQSMVISLLGAVNAQWLSSVYIIPPLNEELSYASFQRCKYGVPRSYWYSLVFTKKWITF